jgi:hypothetical protein
MDELGARQSAASTVGNDHLDGVHIGTIAEIATLDSVPRIRVSARYRRGADNQM